MDKKIKHKNILFKGKNSHGNDEVSFDSKYSKDFYSQDLNEGKYEQLLTKAKLIRLLKNYISNIVHNNIHSMKDMSVEDMIKHFKYSVKGLVGQDIQHAVKQVFTCYSNKFVQIKQKMTFRIVSEIIITKYKRNTASQKKGDIKDIEIKYKSTKLTKVMSFLARHHGENTIQYLNEQIVVLNELSDKESKDKRAFFISVLETIAKYGESRITALAMAKRDNTYRRYNKKAIKFESLTFATISRCKDDIVSYSDNFDGETNAYIALGGMVNELPEQTNELVFLKESERQKTDTIIIPTKYAKDYHGNIKEFSKKEQSYLMCFDQEHKRIRLIISLDGQRSVFIGGQNIVGVDVNVKHNLFATSEKQTIDFDRKLMSGFVNFLKSVDKKKERKNKNSGLTKEQKSSLGRESQKHMNRWIRKMDAELERCSVFMVDDVQSVDGDHIGMEDLSVFGEMFSRSDEFEGFKYSRLCSILNLSSLSDTVKGIAYKRGMSFSLLPAQYSSQKCNDCKYIDRANRLTQEEFCCVSCGYKENADVSSGKNLKEILCEDVLRIGLLDKNDLGELFPKKLSKWKIKDILTSSYGCNNKLTLNVDLLDECLKQSKNVNVL